jgi:flagellar biosynthesis chaperone FliJ
MRRFHWPLERVLTVAEQRELAVRSEVLTLLEQITLFRQQIIQHKAMLRQMLQDLGELDIMERMTMQNVFMRAHTRIKREVNSLEDQVRELSDKRREKVAQLVKLRKRKETLENMRQDARREHEREEMKFEQKQFDENAQIAFARQRLECSAGAESWAE